MGEAKRRGTYEERKALAIARNEKIATALKERLRKEEAASTPEQRKKRAKAQSDFATLATFEAIAMAQNDIRQIKRGKA